MRKNSEKSPFRGHRGDFILPGIFLVLLSLLTLFLLFLLIVVDSTPVRIGIFIYLALQIIGIVCICVTMARRRRELLSGEAEEAKKY